MAQHPIRPIPKLSKEDLARFWSNVDKRGPKECWPWLRGKSYGYGSFAIYYPKEKRVRSFVASRVSLFIAKGMKRRHRGMHALHSCDFKSCVNPRHLFWGTQLDNVADRVKKGRTAKGLQSGRYTKPESTLRGERHPRATISEQTAIEVLRRFRCGLRPVQIYRALNLTKATVHLICSRASWRHLS